MAEKKDFPRGRKIAEQLDGLIDEGEVIAAKLVDGKIEVEKHNSFDSDGHVSSLKESHPELYGQLLSLHAAVDKGGGVLVWLLWGAAIVLSGVVMLGLVDTIFGVAVSDLPLIWFGVIVGAVTIFLSLVISNIGRRMRYAGIRTSVHRSIDDASLSTRTAVSLLEGDGAVERLSEGLKRDVATGRGRF